MDDAKIVEVASKRANAKLGFYTHLSAYIVVNLLLIVINLISPARHYWFIWPLLGWGVGIFFHGMGTYMFLSGSGFKERIIQGEMERLSARRHGAYK